MSKADNLTDFLTDMANTIRTEENTTNLINPKNIHNKIPEFGKKLKNHNENMQKVFETYKASDSGFNWTEYENNENYPDSEYANSLDGLNNLLTDMANTIRTEQGSTDPINPQSFSNKIIKFGDELKKENDSLEPVLGVYPKSIIYGVKLNKSIRQNDSWASYTDDCLTNGYEGAYMDFANDTFVDNGWKDRWPFNQIKPCLLKDGQVVGYLNPNDYSKFEDGTDAGITNTDNGLVMIEIPKIYYQISTDETYNYVKISNKPQEGFICHSHVFKGEELDKIYVSAYLCGTDALLSKGFATASGEALTTGFSMAYGSYWSKLKEKQGERFEFMPFGALKLIQCLYIIMFNNTDSQQYLGYGYNSAQADHVTGLLDNKGMYYGKSEVGYGVKFLGLEDIYGCRKQISTGFEVTSGQARYLDPYDPNQRYAPKERETYKTVENFVKPNNFLRYAISLQQEANITGFFGLEVTTASTQGFSDQTSYTSYDTCALDFGVVGTGKVNGLFAMILSRLTVGDTKRSARLVYFPEK